MSDKQLETLPEDVYNLFDPESDHIADEELLDEMCENLKEILRLRLKASSRREGGVIRFSALGKTDRQLWMAAPPDPDNAEPMLPKVYLKFLDGDVIEQLFLYLAKEAGHTVTDEQRAVEVNGVKGHIDAIIDGTVVDLKSASSFGYKKFKEGTVEQDDPFGYVEQLAGYANVLTPGKPAAWWAVDKSTGDNCISELKEVVVRHHPREPRIEHLKKVIAKDEPPELCYQPIPDGKSGNERLATPCSYCKHKFRCFPETRLFLYSNGPKFLTKVVNKPKVPEVERE